MKIHYESKHTFPKQITEIQFDLLEEQKIESFWKQLKEEFRRLMRRMKK